MKKKWDQSDKKQWVKVVKIGQVAAKLFDRKGYLETSMQDISNGAKLSKGGVYHYFSTKNEILFFILKSYMDLVLADLEKDLSEIDGSLNRIEFIISRHIDLFINNQSEAKTLFRDASCLSSNCFKTIAEQEREYFRIVAAVLSDFLGGDIKKGELTTMTFSLFGMCNWIYSWYDTKGPVTPRELSNIVFETFHKGVGRYRKQGKNKQKSG